MLGTSSRNGCLLVRQPAGGARDPPDGDRGPDLQSAALDAGDGTARLIRQVVDPEAHRSAGCH